MGSFFRTPLGLFVATLAVGAAVIAVGMNAYGGGGALPRPPQVPTAVARARFRHAAVRLCLSARSLQRGIVARGKPRSLRDATRTFHWMTPKVDSMTREVDQLVPPPSAIAVAKHLRRLRRKFDRFDRALDHLDHFAETHQWRSFVLLARSPGFKKLAKSFGSNRKVRKIDCGEASLNIA